MLNTKTIKKVLILRYRFIGDTVLTIPFIRNLREKLPQTFIDVLVSPNSGELLEGNPDLNKIIYFDNTKFHKYEERKQGDRKDAINRASTTHTTFFSCVKALRKENYDLVFVLKRSFSSALLAALSGAKYKIGFNTEFRSFLLTHSLRYDKNLHELDNFLSCLAPLNINPIKYNPVIFPTKLETAKANGFLVRFDRFKPKVLIHASSAHPYKMWPKRYFSQLIDFLFEQYQSQFVFTGAKIDKEIYDKIISQCKNRKKITMQNLCGLTSLRECFSLYQGLDLAICVDSGNAHIAAASGIPTYVLYGPTEPKQWLPIGRKVFPVRLEQLLPCQPCNVKVQCSHLSCMKLLTPELVFNTLKAGANKSSETLEIAK